MAKLEIKKGDRIVVIAGKDKGKKGKILRTLPQRERVIVEGINMVKKHTRPTRKAPQGGITSKEGPIHISNIQLLCSHCEKPTRIRHRGESNEKSARICTRCGEPIGKG